MTTKRYSLWSVTQRHCLWLLWSCALVLLLFAGSGPACAAEEAGDSGDIVVAQQEEDALQRALAGHRADLADLQAQMDQMDSLQDTVRAEIQEYGSQNSAHRQLLLVSRLRIEDLENAINSNRRAYRALHERVGAFKKRWDSMAALLQQTNERIELARSQQTNASQSTLPDVRKDKLAAATRDLQQVLDQKRKLGKRYLDVYRELLVQLESALEENQLLGAKLAGLMDNQNKASLFTRIDRFQLVSGGDFMDALGFFVRRIQAFFSVAAWKSQWLSIKMGGFNQWALFLVLLIGLTTLQGRCRALLERIAAGYQGPGRRYRRLVLLLSQRSLLLADMALLFGIYSTFQFSLLDIGLGRFLFDFFLLFLITRWGMDFLSLGVEGPPTELRSYVSSHMLRFFGFFRWIGAGMILLAWVVGKGSPLTIVSYDILAVVSCVWAVVFWRAMGPVAAEGVRQGQTPPAARLIVVLKVWSVLVFGGFLLLNLVGYNFLAEHWLSAWIKTVALLFWGWVTGHAIREWDQDRQTQKSTPNDARTLGSAHHLRWLLIQLVRLFWLVILLMGLIWSWDRSGYLMGKLVRFFSFSVTIGSLSLSVENVLSALVIIFVTHGSVRIGRALLREKVLDHQPLELGLKHSILTITGYLGWGFGLLLALGTVGINATSLAVVFGALSIGIGFGLQTIFNNFISGLILLFERPIQVGDIVEINGLWAEVKKISVRATVVQTFDNASVIIPNSELISQQVTNWSFKDKRMRRNLEVGVAYGSDIDRVEATLLEIAREDADVLKYPRPDVLFIDHADSALIFRLRFWTHVDNFWNVPSRIRFQIDRRFQALGIEIAFPQRDLHIRTMAGGSPPVPLAGDERGRAVEE